MRLNAGAPVRPDHYFVFFARQSNLKLVLYAALADALRQPP